MSTEQVPNFVLSQNLQKICEHTLSLKDICWLLFTLNDINLTTLQIYNHYNTIDLRVVRLAANYSIFRNFLYF